LPVNDQICFGGVKFPFINAALGGPIFDFALASWTAKFRQVADKTGLIRNAQTRNKDTRLTGPGVLINLT